MPRTMAIIKCRYCGVTDVYGGQRLVCYVGDDRSHRRETVTSQLKSIDFERGMAVTQNNIYMWDVPKL